MEEHSLRKSQQIRNATMTLLQMKWQTKNKNSEAAVFAMNHMETYMGNGIKFWDCKFSAENVSNFLLLLLFFADFHLGFEFNSTFLFSVLFNSWITLVLNRCFIDFVRSMSEFFSFDV